MTPAALAEVAPLPRPSPTTSVARACMAWSCSSKATKSGSAVTRARVGVVMIRAVAERFELHAAPSWACRWSTALSKSAGASAVIYGSVDATGIAFDSVDEALRVPQTELRLFSKPVFTKRRMGVALAFDADVELARTRKLCAGELSARCLTSLIWSALRVDAGITRLTSSPPRRR
jgi:hypothetical protein